MTPYTGIFQHAIFNVLTYAEGYCTDHNARAFILMSLREETIGLPAGLRLEPLASRYLAFMWNAFDQESCRFRNFMSYQRQCVDVRASEHSYVLSLWEAGALVVEVSATRPPLFTTTDYPQLKISPPEEHGHSRSFSSPLLNICERWPLIARRNQCE